MSYNRPVVWLVDESVNPVIKPGQLHGDLDSQRASAAHVLDLGDLYRMYYWGTGADGYNRILATECPKNDLNRWEPLGSVLERQVDADYNFIGPSFPNIVRVTENRWLMYFAGWGRTREDGKLPNMTGVAISEDGGQSFNYCSDQPVLPLDRSWDQEGTGSVFVILEEGQFRMYYTSISRYKEKPPGVKTAHEGMIPHIGIGYAISEDGVHWTKPLDGFMIEPRGLDAEPYEYIASKPFVMREGSGYRMWLNTCSPAYRVHGLYSEDGDHWQWITCEPSEEMGFGTPGHFDDHQRCYMSVINAGDVYHCWYTGNGYGTTGMGYATGVLK